MAYAGLGVAVAISCCAVCFQCASAKWGRELYEELAVEELVFEPWSLSRSGEIQGLAKGTKQFFEASLALGFMNLRVFCLIADPWRSHTFAVKPFKRSPTKRFEPRRKPGFVLCPRPKKGAFFLMGTGGLG